jgi:hypothetical protein
VEVLTNSLAAAYDRNAQLSRENGVLAKRLEDVERELKALRDLKDRLRSVEATNEQLTRLMSRWKESQARTKRRGRSWLPGVRILCSYSSWSRWSRSCFQARPASTARLDRW